MAAAVSRRAVVFRAHFLEDYTRAELARHFGVTEMSITGDINKIKCVLLTTRGPVADYEKEAAEWAADAKKRREASPLPPVSLTLAGTWTPKSPPS